MARRASKVGSVLLTLAMSLPPSVTGQELSVDTIVSRCAQAMGGSGHLEGLRTLKFQYAYRSQDRNHQVHWEIIRPNKLRKEESGLLTLLFDGARAGFLEGPPQEDGTLMGPHLVPEAHIRHFELDIALYVPAFFDFQGEYAGRDTIDGAPAYLVRVTLPSGALVEYAIDAASFLPVRVAFPEDAYRAPRRLGDFREVGGFVFPHRNSSTTEITRLERLEVNPDLLQRRFVFPDGIRQGG